MKTLLRSPNFWILFIADLLLLIIAYYLAFWFRFAPNIPEESLNIFYKTVIPILLFQILVLLFFRCYQGINRYFSLVDALNLVKAIGLSSSIIIVFILFTTGFQGYARSVYILDGLLAFLLLSGIRVATRYLFENKYLIEIARKGKTTLRGKKRRTLIVGAGDAGEQLIRETLQNQNLGIEITGLLDDDKGKNGRLIHGKKVLGAIDDLPKVASKHNLEFVIIAMPSAPGEVIRMVADLCTKEDIPCKTLPGVSELLDGNIQIARIRDVNYRDLLRREPVHLDNEKISESLYKKKVLITGAGGSIGSELCRQVLRFEPSELIICDKTENNLFHIENETRLFSKGTAISPFLVDITNYNNLYRIFCTTMPDVIFHAAAFKHVPIVELNPWEAIKNNIIGTKNTLKCSELVRAKQFVMVSTDKAVRPTNVMGATKRVAELLTIAYHSRSKGTRFVTVRFGNVVGSEGSVIPLFKKQIARGGPVTVTHPDITRFFMTIPEAVQLILQAGTMGRGGEIFILEMGIPVKILDMAKDVIRLSGLRPDVDIEIKFTGLRPGEKLYEELITQGEGIVKTQHEKIMVLKGDSPSIEELEKDINDLALTANTFNAALIRAGLKKIVPEYQPAPDGMRMGEQQEQCQQQ